jgi:serine/threonine protein phosphatase PrpC
MALNNNIFFIQDKGGRDYMEDRIDIASPLFSNYHYFGVFDGHGGSDVVSFVKANMKEIIRNLLIQKHSSQMNEETILYQALKQIVELLPLPCSKTQGTTVVIIIKKNSQIWVANCGDSRAIITCTDGQSIPITYDHKPNREDEYRRIKASGGFVAPSFKGDVYRVNGSLAVSRSIGDLELFPHVTWKPEITTLTVLPHFAYLCIATDGIWDVIQNSEIGTLLQNTTLQSLHNICRLARKRGSSDNISIITVKL